MLQADYYDGRTARAHAVQLELLGDVLLVRGDGCDRQASLASLQITEQLGSAPRLIRFGDGAFCEVRDFVSLAALLKQARYREGWVDLLQRRASVALLAAAMCVAIAFAAWRWGLPIAAMAAADWLPSAASETLGQQTLSTLDRGWLRPSKLDAARREVITARFSHLALPDGGSVAWSLAFRSAPTLGPNALTLPDDTIVLLDELTQMLDNDEQVMAVLGHELGHARHHHALRLLLQGSALAAFWTWYVGDISTLLAVAPTMLLQARYSQEFEREADDYAVLVLQRNGISPLRLEEVLKKVEAFNATREQPFFFGYLSTHPANEARIQRLRDAARARRPQSQDGKQNG